MKKTVVLLVFFVFCAVSFADNKCAYECYPKRYYKIEYCPNTACKARGANEDSNTKIVYHCEKDAICAAAYFREKHDYDGYRVYKCPKKYGYHLTTKIWGIKIKKHKIIDADGKDISSYVCVKY
jgi:hypothetical protein